MQAARARAAATNTQAMENDVVQMEDGGYKRRRIGAKGAGTWQVS